VAADLGRLDRIWKPLPAHNLATLPPKLRFPSLGDANDSLAARGWG